MRMRRSCRGVLATRAMTGCSETRLPVATGAVQMCSWVERITWGP